MSNPAFCAALVAVLNRWDRAVQEKKYRRYRPLRPRQREALELYYSGAVHGLQGAFKAMGSPEPRAEGRLVLLRIQEQERRGRPHPEIEEIQERAKARGAALSARLLVEKVEAAERGIQVLRELLEDGEIAAETRVRIAQDFLDRVAETSKISRSEVNTTASLQLPAQKVDGLLAAMARASAALSRPAHEIQSGSRLLPATGDESEYERTRRERIDTYGRQDSAETPEGGEGAETTVPPDHDEDAEGVLE